MLKGRAGLDIDLARFQGLRNLTNEIDRQKNTILTNEQPSLKEM